MKIKKAPKTLTLSRETLRQLTVKQAQAVQGASTYYCTGDSVNVCCAD